jgi:hypothetical protein
MTLHTALERSIAGGWKPWGRPDMTEVRVSDNKSQVGFSSYDYGLFWLSIGEICIDPLFWQALGKMENWKQDGPVRHGSYSKGEWYYRWHRLIDHLAQGGNISTFFETLN